MVSVILGLWLGAAAHANPEMIPEVTVDLLGHTAPDFDAKQSDGADFKLSQTRGKPVVLSFWASWCTPCRKELPELAAFQKAHPEVAIYAVNVDRERGPAERFLRQVQFDLPIIWDNQAMALGQYNVLSMPTTFVIDAQGTVKLHKVGFSQERGLTEIEQALAGVK